MENQWNRNWKIKWSCDLKRFNRDSFSLYVGTPEQLPTSFRDLFELPCTIVIQGSHGHNIASYSGFDSTVLL